MLNWIIWNRTVYLYKNGFGIKSPTKVDMPFNKETKLCILLYVFFFLIFQDPFGDKRGSFDYQSILKRLQAIKKKLDEKQELSDVEESTDSETEALGSSNQSWYWNKPQQTFWKNFFSFFSYILFFVPEVNISIHLWARIICHHDHCYWNW